MQALGVQVLPLEEMVCSIKIDSRNRMNRILKPVLDRRRGMSPQVEKDDFRKALEEMGHDPNTWKGKRLTLGGMSELYELDEKYILEAIRKKHIDAHYDCTGDQIWVDALDAAHFYYCIKNEAHLYSPT